MSTLSSANKDKILQKLQSEVTSEEFAEIKQLMDLDVIKKPREHLRRIPFIVPVLGAFGLVSMLYGFEKFLDTTVLASRPIELIALGIFLLILTGAAATKL